MCNDFLLIIYLTLNWHFFSPHIRYEKQRRSFRLAQIQNTLKTTPPLLNYKLPRCSVCSSVRNTEKMIRITTTVLPQYDRHFSSYDSKMVLGMTGGSTEIRFIWEALNCCLLYHSADTWGPRVCLCFLSCRGYISLGRILRDFNGERTSARKVFYLLIMCLYLLIYFCHFICTMSGSLLIHLS